MPTPMCSTSRGSPSWQTNWDSTRRPRGSGQTGEVPEGGVRWDPTVPGLTRPLESADIDQGKLGWVRPNLITLKQDGPVAVWGKCRLRTIRARGGSQEPVNGQQRASSRVLTSSS